MTEHTYLTAELIDRFEAVLSDLGPATREMGHMVCVAAHAHVGAGGAVAQDDGHAAWKDSHRSVGNRCGNKDCWCNTTPTAQAMPDGPPLHVAETLIYQIEHGTAFDTSVLLAVLRAHCIALRKENHHD